MSYYNNASSYPPQGQSSSHGQQGGSGGGFANNDTTSQPSYSTNQWQSQSYENQQQQQSAPQYNQNQWQQPPAQQSQQSAPMMQQQQQPSQQGGFMMGQQPQQSDGNNAFNQAAGLAAQAFLTGKLPGRAIEDASTKFLKDSWAKMIPGLEAFLLTLRSYFAVDNIYVLQKMKCVLFPFLKKQWNRNLKGYGGADGTTPQYDLPVADHNAPDLYLPSMALVTYTLLSALLYGNAGKFNPEVIPDVTTKCFLTQVIEVIFIRLGVQFLLSQVNNPNLRVMALLDILSYTGYKYVGLSINMLLGLMAKHFGLGARVYYITFLYTASAASFFMLKTMTFSIPKTLVPSADSKRSILVIVIAALQFATMWFVSQTKFL